jgi:hypothetical protein
MWRVRANTCWIDPNTEPASKKKPPGLWPGGMEMKLNGL